MAATQKAWNSKMRSTFLEMQAAVLEVALTNLPHPSLETQIPLVLKLKPAMARVLIDLLAQETEALSSRHEYELFVTDFTAFLTQLLPQLARLGSNLSLPAACSACSAAAAQDLFWTLWRYLLAVCLAFRSATKKGPDPWPAEQQPFYTPLYTAFYSLLTWLLSMSRSPAWLHMKRHHGLNMRNHELNLILEQPTKCLVNLSLAAALPNFNSHLEMLPPAFLPLLCCLVTEHLGNAPPIVQVAQSATDVQATTYRQGLAKTDLSPQSLHDLLVHLTLAIHNLTCISEGSDHPARLAFLRSPSIIQFLKVVLIKAAGKPTDEYLVENCLPSLVNLLQQQVLHCKALNECRLLEYDSEHNRDDVGLPLHLNPLLSRPALETDARLLHTLSINTAGHRPLLTEFYQVQCEILQRWSLSFRLCSLTPFEAVPLMLLCVIDLSRHCTSHALQRMHQMAGQAVLCKPKLIATDVRRQQQQQQQQQEQQLVAGCDAAELGDAEREMFGWPHKASRGIRGLMYAASTFQVKILGEYFDRIGPDSLKLLSWCETHGWTAAVEALYRGDHHAISDGGALQVTLIFMEAVTAFVSSSSIDVLQGYISLAGTVRKMVGCHLQQQTPSTTRPEMQRTQTVFEQLAQSLRLQETGKRARKSAPQLMRCLMQAVELLNSLPPDGSCSGGGHGRQSSNRDPSVTKGNEGSITQAGSSNGNWRGQHGKQPLSGKDKTTQADNRDGDNWGKQPCQGKASSSNQDKKHESGRGSCNATDESALRWLLLQRLQAMTLIIFVQVCLWRLECECLEATLEERSKIPEWFSTVLRQCQQIHDSKLRIVVHSILIGGTYPEPRPGSEVYVMFERYATSLVYGRLLPGCCHLGCINLEGVSEAALKTQLCSGCRKARYCSVKCQKAAWLGGHSTACGM